METELYQQLMEEALKYAKIAYFNNEIPIGALIVDKNNKIIAGAANSVEKDIDPTSHAEIKVIRKVAEKLKTWKLNEYKLITTLEPCSMCMSCILNSRIKTVIFAAPASTLKNKLFYEINLTKINLTKINLIGKVLEKDSVDLLKTFFKELRN